MFDNMLFKPQLSYSEYWQWLCVIQEHTKTHYILSPSHSCHVLLQLDLVCMHYMNILILSDSFSNDMSSSR